MPATAQRFGFSEARYRSILYLPYCYSHVASLIPVERPGLGTMAVDKHMRVYYDPELFERYPIDECTAMILHEDLHVLLHHHQRFADYLGGDPPTERQHKAWNLAADCTVNQVLRDVEYRKTGEVRRLTIGKDWVLPDRLGLPDGLTTEEYFEKLMERDDPEDDQADQPRQSPGQQGGESGEPYDGDEKPEPGQGGGSGASDGQEHEWECPPPEDCDTPGQSEFNQQMTEQDVAQRTEAAKSRGSVPGELVRMAERILRPRVDPYKKLRAAVRYAATVTRGLGELHLAPTRQTAAGGGTEDAGGCVPSAQGGAHR